MSYAQFPPIPSLNVIGNSSSSDDDYHAIALVAPLAIAGGAISAAPAPGGETVGDYTIQDEDFCTSLQSTDNSPVVYTLPSGLSGGFKCRSYQVGTGTITYTAGVGATLANIGTVTSGGQILDGFYADIENLGNNEWVITGVLS